MGRKVRSIKGEVVDFDLFEIKKQIEEKPVSKDVKNREDFVYAKRKRGSKRTVGKMLNEQRKNTEDVRAAMRKSTEANISAAVGESGVVDTKEKPVKKTVSKRRIIKKKK
jgi:hypothetical protein